MPSPQAHLELPLGLLPATAQELLTGSLPFVEHSHIGLMLVVAKLVWFGVMTTLRQWQGRWAQASSLSVMIPLPADSFPLTSGSS